MSWWHVDQFAQKRGNLEKRALVIQALRRFFMDQNFTEVQTPALQICPTFDTHIHAFQTDMLAQDRSLSKAMYLHTSPEFDMKKLLAAGMERIYQICPVYRNAEGLRLHSPEFTLLEWYRTKSDYTALMDDCAAILRMVSDVTGISHFIHDDKKCDPYQNMEKLSVCGAFQKYADINLTACCDDTSVFAQEAKRIGVRVVETDRWDDIFHAIMAEKIEPYLGVGVPTILYDYPVSMAALSRRKADDPRFAERFELYVCGVELANAFSELTDPVEQRARYETEMTAKQKLYGEQYPPDESFFEALAHMPESAGIALGVDRLVMLACGASHIHDVLWAPVSI